MIITSSPLNSTHDLSFFCGFSVGVWNFVAYLKIPTLNKKKIPVAIVFATNLEFLSAIKNNWVAMFFCFFSKNQIEWEKRLIQNKKVNCLLLYLLVSS